MVCSPWQSPACFQLLHAPLPVIFMSPISPPDRSLYIDSDGNPTTFATGLVSPQGIAFDLSKNLYVCDAGDGGDGNGLIMRSMIHWATAASSVLASIIPSVSTPTAPISSFPTTAWIEFSVCP